MEITSDKKRGFCTNCGAVIIQNTNYCGNCGSNLIKGNKQVYAQLNSDIYKSSFFNQNKYGILFFIVITFIMLVFPPIEWGLRTSSGKFISQKTGFYFILSYSGTGKDWGMRINEAHINVLQLLFQTIIVFIISFFVQYISVKTKMFSKNYY